MIGTESELRWRVEDDVGLLFSVDTTDLVDVVLSFDWRTFSADSADQLVAEAERLLGRLTDKSAAVLRIAKRALRAGMAAGFDEALPTIEAIYTKSLMSLEDPEEGLKAFMEKRKPVWKHR